MGVTYSITDLETLSGIPAHTIRTWERRYGLFSPTRDAVNVRCYDEGDVAHLHHVVRLLKQGHRISSIASKSREEIATLAKESSTAPGEGDLTEALCIALQEFDVLQVENMLHCFIRKEGFDTAVAKRFVPFLDQIPFLLLTGVLKPAQVQILYSALRQKLHAESDALTPSRNAPRWLLVHQQGMQDPFFHDLMYYLLRKNGKIALDAGALSPEELRALITTLKPDGYCLVCGSGSDGDWLDQMLNVIPASQGNTLVLLPGKTLEFANTLQTEGLKVLSGAGSAFEFMF